MTPADSLDVPDGRRPDLIRLAVPRDSEALLALQRRLDTQSSFMLLEPGERDDDAGRLHDRLATHGATGSFDLVAQQVGHGRQFPLLGWLAVGVQPYRRAAHVGHIVLGVDGAHAGHGVGRALLVEAVAEAGRRRLGRLELTVMTDNVRAVRLYLSVGFVVEGLRRGSVRRNGALVDEYHMAKLLPST